MPSTGAEPLAWPYKTFEYVFFEATPENGGRPFGFPSNQPPHKGYPQKETDRRQTMITIGLPCQRDNRIEKRGIGEGFLYRTLSKMLGDRPTSKSPLLPALGLLHTKPDSNWR